MISGAATLSVEIPGVAFPGVVSPGAVSHGGSAPTFNCVLSVRSLMNVFRPPAPATASCQSAECVSYDAGVATPGGLDLIRLVVTGRRCACKQAKPLRSSGG